MDYKQHLERAAAALGASLVITEEKMSPRTGFKNSYEIGEDRPGGVSWGDSSYGQQHGRKLYADVWNWDDTQYAYLVGLHELGHLANGDQSDMSRLLMDNVEKEAQAWDWAFSHAKEPLTEDGLRGAREDLDIYAGMYGAFTSGRPAYSRVLSKMGARA